MNNIEKKIKEMCPYCHKTWDKCDDPYIHNQLIGVKQ